ncbi:BioY family transporter [Neorhizobium sp. SOG26]|uniref:Biotin transporter n=1 Tax=Neorhizobium turbinariae TaxID=2937795 RepID=A0ABT0IS19_9HYPH|nr:MULTISPECIES: biotin transporter BioY [Neorhizobium]AXV14601.1 BioY family transporter [Neorhizobium sp. SOG26]MCK8780658.1 biotin transporter BioY [Neorhizobium turbinariae]
MATRDLVLAALFAAIIVALGLVPPIMLGFIPVPITAQSLGVMLAGVILGAKRGGLAVLLVLVLVAIGLPVLSGGRGGLATFVLPTAGYLVGWFFAAVAIGYCSERFVGRSQSALVQVTGFFMAAMIGGVVILHGLGILWLAYGTGTGLSTAFLGDLAFIPGDILKAAIAALAGRAVMVGYPLLPQRA